MAADIQALRKQAKAAGVPVSEVRTMTAAELRDAISAGGSSKSRKANPAKGRKTRPTAKARPAAKRGRPAKTEKRRGPGRPKGSTNKPTAAKTTAKRGRGRPAKAATATRARAASNGDAGRNFLTGINWGDHEAWNPRKNSPPDQIIRLVRKHKGNRSKVVADLMPRIRDFVTLPKGVNAKSDAARDRLAYRVSRVMWEFALKTGQHEKATNRAAPGQGERYAGNGRGSKRRAQKAATTAKRRGRPVGSKNRTSSQRGSQTRAAGKRGPGRPKGSKNRPKAGSRK